MNVQPFSPMGATAPLAATAASGSVAITVPTASVIRIANLGPNKAFVRFGTGAQTALATDTPILPNSVEVFSKGTADTFAAICAATETAALYVTSGEGQ